MDFALAPEQELLRQSAREVLSTTSDPAALGRLIVDLDWLALPFPGAFGGADASLLDLAVLLEEFGRAHAPGLFRSAILGGLAVLEGGTEWQKREWVPRIVSGEISLTLAVRHSVNAPVRLQIDEHGVLSGTALFVADAERATHIVCAADDARDHAAAVSLCLVESADVRTTPLLTTSGEAHFVVDIDDLEVGDTLILGTPGDAAAALERVFQVAALATCAELLGGAQRVLELAVAQGKERHQFGRPIGSFQAVQHHCANMLIDVELSRFLTYQAAWLLSERMPCRQQISMAKAFVSEAYGRVVALGHEVLGGNGLIDEHEMPLFSRRALADQQLFGSGDFHREVVAQELGLQQCWLPD